MIDYQELWEDLKEVLSIQEGITPYYQEIALLRTIQGAMADMETQ